MGGGCRWKWLGRRMPTRGRMVIRGGGVGERIRGGGGIVHDSRNTETGDEFGVVVAGPGGADVCGDAAGGGRVGNVPDVGLVYGRLRDVSEESVHAAAWAVTEYTVCRGWRGSRGFMTGHTGRGTSICWRRTGSTGCTLFLRLWEPGIYSALYPYFFDTEGFPDVHLGGVERRSNRSRIRRRLQSLIKMCHNRGIKLTVGIWDHIYRGGLQWDDVLDEKAALGEKPTAGLPWGVTDKVWWRTTRRRLRSF